MKKKFFLSMCIFLFSTSTLGMVACYDTNNNQKDSQKDSDVSIDVNNNNNNKQINESNNSETVNESNNSENLENKNNPSTEVIAKEGEIDLPDFNVNSGSTNSNNNSNVNIPGAPNIDFNEYKSLSFEERNKIDLAAYIDALKERLILHNDYPNPNFLPLEGEALQIYNQKSNFANQPDFVSAYARDFSVAENDNLVLNPLKQKISAAYWQSTFNNRGLARYLPNQLYKNIALQTFAITISNSNDLISDKKSKTFNGTAWILDYQLNENGYPTKWYLATNLHVIAQLTKNQVEGRYSNVVNLELEKNNFEKAKKTLELVTNKFNKEKETGIDDIDNPYLSEWQIAHENFKKADSYIGLTKRITLEHFNDLTPLNQSLLPNSKAPTLDTFTFEPSQVKIIYAANDFLKTSPKSYLNNNSPYKDLEEMADFAVLEINFENDKNNYVYKSNLKLKLHENEPATNKRVVNSAHELAKIATSNFANWDATEKFKFPTKSLKETYEQLKNKTTSITLTNGKILNNISKENVEFLALGFPNSSTDNQLTNDEIRELGGKELLSFTQSLWINKPFYIVPEVRGNAGSKIFTKDYGTGWNQSLSIRNWLNMPGVTDLTITAPIINQSTEKGFDALNLKDTLSVYQGNEYINYGLGYSIGAWQPLQGASGSSVRTIDNEIIGINYASNDAQGFSQTSLIQAFRSEGDDYNGFYGNYKLEEYDLIYGGGKNQRTSYRQALNSENANIRTWLFPNGSEESNIPNEYSFNK